MSGKRRFHSSLAAISSSRFLIFNLNAVSSALLRGVNVLVIVLVIDCSMASFSFVNFLTAVTAVMNSSEQLTEMLNFDKRPGCCFAVMNSIMSGCQTSNTPIIAPFRILPLAFLLVLVLPEPAVIISDDVSNISIYLTAPGVSTPIPKIKPPLGRIYEKFSPHPPSDFNVCV